MFYVNVWLSVKKPEDVARVSEALAEVASITISEEACIRIEAYHSQSDDTKFLLVEHWRSETGWRAHRNEAVFTDIYQEQVLPFVDRQAHICTILE